MSSFKTVGKFGNVDDGTAAARKEAKEEQARRQQALAAGAGSSSRAGDDAALTKEELLEQLLGHWDADGTGGLDYNQFLLFFKALDPNAALTRIEFVELCESLEMAAETGVTSLELFFEDDLDAIQALHGKVVKDSARMSGPCPVCGCLPTGDAAGERMQVAKGGCLCNELRVEFGSVAPARIKFGKRFLCV